MNLDFQQIEKAVHEERDLDREAWDRGDRASDKGLTLIFTGFDHLTPTEHAQQAIRHIVNRQRARGADAPKIPSVNTAHMPHNCSYDGCRNTLWSISGQERPFCHEHDTPENRESYGW